MKNCIKVLIIALIVQLFGQILAPNTAQAQVVEVGGTVGLSYYMGDINPKMPFISSSLGWGVLARYYEGTRWAFRLTYSNLQVNGSDKDSGYRPERGLSFNTKVHDFAAVAEFNFLDYFTGSRRSGLSPYLFGGVSVFAFNPKADDGTELCNVLTDVDYDQRIPNDGTDKYSKISMSLPFGVGVKYSMGQKLGVALEWRWDYTFTDWIDDCHAYYPTYKADAQNVLPTYATYSDPTGFTGVVDPTGIVGNEMEYIQRGNKADNDWFGYLNFSLTYKFVLPGGKDCNKREKYKKFD